MPDVILTGLPRSGSALASALVDGLPDAVCLNAPQHQSERAGSMRPIPYCKWLAGDFLWTRAQLRRQEPFLDLRNSDGTPLTDGQSLSSESIFPVVRPGLSSDFTLAVRHHALFSSLLPLLASFDHFTIIAVIRHPLQLIASWLRAPTFPMHKENAPGLKQFWPEAFAVIQSEGKLADRLAQLYDLHMQRYYELRERIHIVKYEDIVASPKNISRIFGLGEVSSNASLIRKSPAVYSLEEGEQIREALHRYGLFTRFFYDKL